MQNVRSDISARFLDYSANAIRLILRLGRTSVGRHVANQLMRSATSAGANYEEACAAESRADFLHKLQIVLKELRESSYWLRIIERSALIRDNDALLGTLLQETQELSRIIGKSIVTAKSN